MKICALVIGHKKLSPGASNSASGLSEFSFNDKLSAEIEREVSGVIVQRVYRRTYRTLPGDINELNPDFIISLHCNAFNKKVSGTEVLYYHRSTKGKLMAEMINPKLFEALGLNNRGERPKHSEDRGGYLLKSTVAPCVIVEPFFIDNDSDLKIAMDNYDALVQSFSRSVEAIANIL